MQRKNFCDGRAVPLGRRLLLAFSGTLNTLFQPVGTRGQYFLPFKLGGNLLRSHAIQGHTVDTLDHLGGLIVYDPVFGVIRVFHIAIGRLSHRLTRIALDLIADSALFGNVPRIPLVEQVADRGKLVIALGRINVVRNCYKTDIVLREKFFGQAADLDVVSAKTGQILHKDRCCLALFELLDHFHEAGAIHGHAGNAVVQEMHQIGVAFFLGYLSEQFFLIANAVTLAFQIIVTGKPLIEEGCHITGLFIVRLFHKSSFLGQSDNKFSCVL